MKSDRKTYLEKVKRAVIKIGSGVLTRKNGLNLNVYGVTYNRPKHSLQKGGPE